MNLYADFKLLDETLLLLVGKDDTARARAAADLKIHVELAARELSLERFSKFENELYQSILSYVNGNTIPEKIGGILAIRELVDCTSAAAETKVMKFAKALSSALSSSQDFALIELIADALGHMAKNSPVSHVDYLESELNRSLDWLRSGKGSINKKFAACAVLQQLAKNARTIFFSRINEFFDLIWSPIWDSKEQIRLAAGRALSACLAVLKERTYHLQWYCYIYDQLQEGFHHGTEEYVHGSILVVTEVLKYTGDFMVPRFKEICKAIMALKDHKSRIVRASIVELLPSLASLCPDAFARAHMDESIDFLLKCSKSSEIRAQALLATGKLSLSLGSHLVNRIDELMNILKEAFGTSTKKSKGVHVEVIPEALICVSDMVQGLGAPFHGKVYALLEPMLQSGLTSELIDTLSVICSYMPNQKAIVQSRLLEEATKVLGGESKPTIPEPGYAYSWAKKGERLPKSHAHHSHTGNDTQLTNDLSSVFGPGILHPVASMSSIASTQVTTNIASSTTMTPTSRASMNLSNQQRASLKNAAGIPRGVSPAPPVTPNAAKKTKKTFSFMNTFTKSSSTPHNTKTVDNIGVAAIGMGLGLLNEHDTVPSVNVSSTNEIAIVALRTLASLSIPNFNLIPLLQQSVLPYFLADDYLVRKEASVTATKMISTMLGHQYAKGPTAFVIEDIVTRLLEVCMADTSTIVRLAVLKSFTIEFDRHLSRSHHVDTLMLLLADECFEVRLHTLSILGRLAISNPASVLPSIRMHLSRLISEMKSSADYKMIEEAATMLCNFMKFPKFHFLVKPVMSTILESLPIRSDVRTTTAALETLGELSMVLQYELLPYVDSLVPVIIHHMFDSSSMKKQEVAIRTLGQFVKSTGLVVRPYLQYPQLLPKTLDLLCKNSSNKPVSFRMELLRVLGLLGALEPYRYSIIVSFLQSVQKEKNQGGSGNEEKAVVAAAGKAGVSVDRDGVTTTNATNTTTNVERVETERDRAESNLSQFHAALNPQQQQQQSHIRHDSEGRLNNNAATTAANNRLEQDDIIRTETLLYGDSADLPSQMFMYEQSVMRALPEPPQEKMIHAKHSPNSEDFYPRVALSSLVKILQDPTLSIHHSTATQTIVQIFCTLGSRCLPYLEYIFPYFLQIVRRSGAGLRESILQQISQLVAITGHYIIPYLPSILEVIQDFWYEHLEYVLAVVQQIALTTADSFDTFLTKILPLLLSSLVLPRDLSTTIASGSSVAVNELLKPFEETLSCVKILRASLRIHLHLLIPKLCKLLGQLQEYNTTLLSTQLLVVQTIRYLITGSKGAVVDQANVIGSILIHTMCRTLLKCYNLGVASNDELYTELVLTITIYAQQVGHRIISFDSLIHRSIENKGIDTSIYKELIHAIKTKQWHESMYIDQEDMEHSNDEYDVSSPGESSLLNINRKLVLRSNTSHPQSPASPYQGVSKLVLNQTQLQRAWDVAQRSTASDWHEWLWRFNVDLIRESPSPTLRACSSLAQAYPPIAKELFHAAFVSCWHELSEPYQESLVKALQTAFKSATIPSEILQTLLNLAEFMEHDVEALPISLSILAELAQKGHAYAKALHYRELEFQTNPAGCFENLININKKLNQYEAAAGLMKVAKQIQKKFPELKEIYTVQESWLAKLGYWDEALQKYDERLTLNTKDSVAISGKMKCLEALGRWEETVKLCEENLDHMRVESETLNSNTHTKAAVIGARAAWSLNEWDLMDSFVSQLPSDNMDGCFMKAVLSVHRENFIETQKYLEATRKHLDKNISSLMNESYGRAYMPLIMVQQCAELEEIVEYKMFLKDSKLTSSLESIAVTPSALTPSLSSNALHLAQVQLSSFNEAKSQFTMPRKPNRHPSMTMLLETDQQVGGLDGGQGFSVDAASSTKQTLVEEAQRRKVMLSEKWRRRIRGCASSGRAAIPYWKYLLNGRRMVLSEKEDLDTWLDFVSLCRNGGNSALAERVLMMSQHSALGQSPHSSSPKTFPPSFANSLQAISEEDQSHAHVDISWNHNKSNSSSSGSILHEEDIIMDRRIHYAMLKQRWSKGDRNQALQGLDSLVRNTKITGSVSAGTTLDSSYLHCLLKLGEWKISILDPGQAVDMKTRLEVLGLYSRATAVDPNSYHAYHQWGLCNYRAIEEIRGMHMGTGRSPIGVSLNVQTPKKVVSIMGNKQGIPINSSIPREQMISFAVNAIKGLMRALTLGTRKFSSSVMQDMLCILSVWFRYGKVQDVNLALDHGLMMVPIDNWLGVLPQLIARIDHPDKETRQLLHKLIIRLGVKHAQALVYPLSVALKSPKGERKEAAEALMKHLQQQNTKLIDQALLVSQELVRVAISWEESWHWALEDASRQCFGEGNIQGMIDTLQTLHEQLEKPSTIREHAFVEAYKYELTDAWNCLLSYKKGMTEKGVAIPTKKGMGQAMPEDAHITQAWDFYYPIFKRINTQLPHINALDLPSCSPNLHVAMNLDLGVPGTYTVNGQAVRIQSFHPIVAIIRSKQRPRKLRITGEDGAEFVFLLKGHEDLRQDERAMQLFGLVNALLYYDRRTSVNGEDYQIQRYAVMPLSPTVGLIGWVPNCDTLHDLIRNYRDSRKIMLDVEHRLILQVAPGKLYDNLPAMHKLEVFEHAMAFTAGEDLAKILWLKSEHSESWLQRRATYTRSLAVMSMVGYILGLGDRHPSNLMLDRKTGKILHIDFGDCFEVAKHREKFPEKVPFRLTRMLVQAMEVAGIEGNYRATCEKVMAVLRENRDSLVATLEAFVHDPLISWRLMNINTKTTNKVEPVAIPSTPAKSDSSPQSSAEDADILLYSPRRRDPTETPPKTPAQEPEAITAGAEPVGRPRSRSITKAPYMNTLAPIAELPEVNGTSKATVVGTDDKVSTLSSSLSLQSPVGMESNNNSSSKQVTPRKDNNMISVGFADHSVASDVIGTSYRKTHHIMMLDASSPVPAAVDKPILGGGILHKVGSLPTNASKTVSFSLMNQTIDADNTIRRSSVTMAIVPPTPPTPEADSDDEENLESEKVVPRNLGRSPMPSVLAQPVVAIETVNPEVDTSGNNLNSDNVTATNTMINRLSVGGNTGNASHVSSSSSTRPGANASLHLEMASLANSISQVNTSRILAASGRHSTSLRNSYVGSVMSHTMRFDGEDIQQQELTEKAVVVIRRVLDKLTGLDFAEVNTTTGVSSQTALEVEEQVDRLIREATSNENLSQSFFGWCPFW